MNSVFNWLFGMGMALAENGGDVVAEEAASMGIIELLASLIPMLLLVVVFYFMLIRPQRKKDKKAKEMLANLKHGDRICTIGGIYGTIVNIKDDTFTISVGQDDVKLVIARWAVRSLEDEPIENEAEVLA